MGLFDKVLKQAREVSDFRLKCQPRKACNLYAAYIRLCCRLGNFSLKEYSGVATYFMCEYLEYVVFLAKKRPKKNLDALRFSMAIQLLDARHQGLPRYPFFCFLCRLVLFRQRRSPILLLRNLLAL